MADKRMFSKSIIDSDLFLDMSLSTQALYFHLCMRADDDGFINNPKRIMKLIGSNDDELKILIAKSFVIPFDSGVCVIKHWRIHNYIKGDRYHPTLCQEEKSQLEIGANKTYEIMEPTWNQLGTKLEPQIRLDKNRLDKNRLDKNRLEEKNYSDSSDNENDNFFELLELASKSNFILSSIQRDKLKSDIELYGKDEVRVAIEISDNNGKHNYSYLKAVLERRRSGTEPKKGKKKTFKNGFNNFEGRNRTEKDMNNLEKKLLGWDKDE